MRQLVIASALLFAGCTSEVAGMPPAPDDNKAGGNLGSDTGDANGGESANTYARVCAVGTVTKGIDVSYYQGSIDWTQVANAGTKFAFIRVSDGLGFKDPKFATYWAGAHSAGLVRGTYQFFRPAQNVQMQADLLINAIGGTYTPGDLPPVLDVEDTGGLGASTVAARVRSWVDYVKSRLGVDPIVYTGKYFWRDQVGGPMSFANNPLWIAQYTSLCPDLPAPWTTWTFWQNSSAGHVAGISGNVDTDQFNGTLEQLQAFAMGTVSNAPPPPPSTCMSATMDKELDDGACVQAASDGDWYRCEQGLWVGIRSTSGCSETFGWCESATLGTSVPPRTCVQAASDHVWYQCDGTHWATPVSNGEGPAGACASEHGL